MRPISDLLELVRMAAAPEVHSTDDSTLFPYMPALMQKAHDAFRALLWQRMLHSTRPSEKPV